MTDEQMDARLQAAGERWRAATADLPAPVGATGAGPTAPAAPARRRHWGLLASAALVAAALVVGGTIALRGIGNHDRTAAGDSTGLAGTVWQLLGYGDHLFPSSLATFYIGTDGTLVADDGCTLIGAKANASGGHLYPTDIEVRDRSCTDSTLPTFSTGLDLLTAGPTYSVDGKDLTISAGSTAMHLTALPDAVPPTLDLPTFTDTDWRLSTVTDASGNKTSTATVDFASAAAATLRVDGGELTAGGGISADVAVDGPRVDVKNFAANAEGSIRPDPSLATEFAVLQGPFEQTVAAGQLTLTKKGVGTLVYDWGPSDEQATDPATLVGRNWHLSSVVHDPAAASDATLRFTGDGHYTANDGCSTFTGPVEVRRGVFSFTGVPKTPSCGGAKGDQATTIDSFLATTALWSVRDGKLIVDGGGAQAFALVYDADSSRPVPTPTRDDVSPLAGTHWTLTAIEQDNANSGSGESGSDLRITVSFTASRYAARYPCATFEYGSYDLHGSTLSVAAPDKESVGSCAGYVGGSYHGAADERHNRIVQGFLRGTVAWSIDGNELTLKNGSTTLTFDAR